MISIAVLFYIWFLFLCYCTTGKKVKMSTLWQQWIQLVPKKACTLVKYFYITQYHLLLLEQDLPDSIKYLLWRLGHRITAHGNSEQQSVSALGSQWTGIFFFQHRTALSVLFEMQNCNKWMKNTHTQFGSWSLHQVLNQFLLMDSHTHINSHKGWPRGEEIELAVCNAAPCVCNQRRLRIQDHCKTLWSVPGEPVTAGGSCSYHQIWL